jgi:hypothetical protein
MGNFLVYIGVSVVKIAAVLAISHYLGIYYGSPTVEINDLEMRLVDPAPPET